MAEKVFTITLLVEADPRQMRQAVDDAHRAIKGHRSPRYGAIAIRIYDENNILVGSATTGTPSVNLQDRLEEGFDHERAQPA